ncbi:hypothetical protein N7456_011915 [Penicillium angulare]|uniref:Vps72/YL1 C-terminal domain-containing protein n=1 Tax=Penicillium angulare TaxID=116970 RepID=A0A9W9EUS9_9EURO|nr:hypothetical protein N7456_011915 [Penicillium angulare]
MTDIMETDPSTGIVSSEDEREEEEEEIQVESLVQGRAKRSNAGLRMSALIDAAADDDLTLLFEEVEDDNEFAMEENAEDEELALDSSSDDEDDQGPNAQNDYDGEKQLQKDERKKRRAQNDLRFQTLRKRVKIDPTAVSAIPAPPRPKKKSERISWIPTVEDGPTRSSSRRQTMVNKEMTHARLKDSQEKRVRIIATMKEAEKRKAHLKPKEMTQEDHLAEAERIERTNSKSLNRWEQAERRKADERRAKIEALQNRRLDGPVMSYWSGLATWVNGRLTRVGKAEIKAKAEKEVAKKKKTEKDVKPADIQGTSTSAVVAPTDTSAAPASTLTPATTDPSATLPATQSTNPSTQPEGDSKSTPTPAPAAGSDTATTDQKSPLDTSAQANLAPEATTTPSNAPADEKANEKSPLEQPTQQENDKPTGDEDGVQGLPTEKDKEMEPEQTPESTANAKTPEPPRKSSLGHPLPVVEIITRRKSTTPAPQASHEGSTKSSPAQNADAMDIDKKPEVEPTTKPEEPPTTTNANPPSNNTDTPTVSGDTLQNDSTNAPVPSAEPVTSQSATSTTTPLAAQPPPVSSADAAPLSGTPPEITTTESRASIGGPDGPAQEPADNETPPQPDIPPVIEHTGRNLTILENFDDRTAHSKKYSIYFNARKPPRLAKISSSLCVITSLPSRYRDPETALPYANSYAYGQIRRLQAQGYIWSAMLGCFVGPAELAARGVPARFLGGEKSAEEIELEKKEKEKAEKEKAEKAQADKEKAAKDKAEKAKAKKQEQELPKDPSASTTEKAEPVTNGATAPTTTATTTATGTSAEPMDIDGGK